MLRIWISCIVGVIITAVTATLIHPEWKIYYDVATNRTIDIIDTDNPRTHYYKTKTLGRVLRIGFGPIPCSCQGLTCGCCSGINITYFDFNRVACMNLAYDPYEFSLMLDMLMNNETILSQRVSGKNPPPACMPVALPLPFAPSVDMCVKLFNIHTPGYNLFMCMDFETRIAKAPVLVLHFDCMQMGADGIHLQKPEDSLTTPAIEEEDGETPSTGDIEVYDEVYEENKKNKSAGAVGKPKM